MLSMRLQLPHGVTGADLIPEGATLRDLEQL